MLGMQSGVPGRSPACSDAVVPRDWCAARAFVGVAGWHRAQPPVRASSGHTAGTAASGRRAATAGNAPSSCCGAAANGLGQR